MTIREALISDIEAMHRIRMAVTENVLNNPDLVKAADYEAYITRRGAGWVYETDGQIVGFGILDQVGKNIWALFVDPEFENNGIGKALHKVMIDRYFSLQRETIWLSTGVTSRAVGFYNKLGWREMGKYNDREIRMELTFEDWAGSKGNSPGCG